MISNSKDEEKCKWFDLDSDHERNRIPFTKEV